MSDKVYKKVGRRYKEIGWEWTGFPCDGVWLVRDGSQSCMIRLGDVPEPSVKYRDIAIESMKEKGLRG